MSVLDEHSLLYFYFYYLWFRRFELELILVLLLKLSLPGLLLEVFLSLNMRDLRVSVYNVPRDVPFMCLSYLDLDYSPDKSLCWLPREGLWSLIKDDFGVGLGMAKELRRGV